MSESDVYDQSGVERMRRSDSPVKCVEPSRYFYLMILFPCKLNLKEVLVGYQLLWYLAEENKACKVISMYNMHVVNVKRRQH